MKEKEEKRVPQLRFPEFTDDWEQRKLGEVYNFQYGEFNNNPDNGGKYPVYGANGIIGGYTNFNAEDSSIIGHMGAYAGYVVWAAGKHFVTYNGTIAKPSDNSLDSKFGYYILSQKKIYRICAGSGQPFVSYADLNGIDVEIPKDKNEQVKIGTYFSNLDYLITLHQRKLEKLKELKKGLVQKLFSQEVRFKADDGSEFPEWEEKKLGDVTSQYKVRNKKRLPLEIYSVNNIVGFIPQSEQFDDAGYLKDTDTSIYMVVPPKHFAYNPARLDIGSIGFQCLDHDVQVSSLYEVFETSDLVNDRFLWSWFHTYYFNNVVKRLQEGGVRLYFYYDKMQEVKIRLPSLPEQQKIADCLSSLDDGIAKQKATLAAWEELKKGLLQQMFV